MIGSLFSGIGGLELGLERAGLGPVAWQVEADPFCREVLAKHWPDVTRYEDVRHAGAATLARVGLICGGFPCQDVSAAGAGAGLAGARSGLWYEFARIVGELRPRWVVVENVASGAKRWVDAVVSGLGQLGYAALPVPLSAADVGAPHRRARIFVVARRVSDPGEHVGDAGGQRLEVNGTDRAGNEEHGTASRTGGDMGDASGLGRRSEAEHEPESQPSRGQGNPARPSGRSGMADPDGDGCEGGRLAQHDEQRSAPGTEPLGRGDDGGFRWPPGPLDDAGWQAWDGPQPAVRRGADGLPRSVDRARLRALGNSVVPQCAEVIGWMIQELT